MSKSDYLPAYQRACSILRQLGEILETEGELPLSPLRQAADSLMQAIAADESRVEPYVLLAEIFFCLDKHSLVDKYIMLAEQRDSQFPELQRLKERILNPSLAAAAQKPRRVARQIGADAIQRVARFEQEEQRTKSASNHPLKRFFEPLLPLLTSPLDLRHWVQTCFGYELSDAELKRFFLLAMGQAPGSPREQILELKALLEQIQPEFGQRPSLFAQELSRSGPGVLRQVQLLLSPFGEKFSSAQQVQNALEAGFGVTLEPAQVETLFQLMHWREPDWAKLAAPRDTLLILKAALERILPDSSEQMDIAPVLEQFRDYAIPS